MSSHDGNESDLQVEPLFEAAGRSVYPFIATKEAVIKIAEFIHSFPLATNADMTDEQIFHFVMSPHNVFVQSGEALIMLEHVEIGKSAHVGFVFWDRKVSGNDEFVCESLQKLMEMFKLHRYYTQVPERNVVMARMLDRIGFVQEGRFREAFLLKNGEFCDILHYGALKGELNVKHRDSERQV